MPSHILPVSTIRTVHHSYQCVTVK